MTGRRRPRGFVATWRPQEATLKLLSAVEEVLSEYADYLPLTLRQIFCRLVGLEVLPKTRNAYQTLGDAVGMARRARRIPMSCIRDDGAGLPYSLLGWTSGADLASLLLSTVERFELDLQGSQLRRLIVLCEAAGMHPQLRRVAHPYGIEVFASDGFDSISAKFALAQLMAEAGGAFEVLHIGDLDQHGEDIFTCLSEDCGAFARSLGASVTFARLAVTEEQFRLHDLPTAPAKVDDRRASTTQAEALPPDLLARIVDDAIRSRLDLEQVVAARRESRDIRRDALRRLRHAGIGSRA